MKHGQLVAHAYTASELLDKLMSLGERGRGSTMWFEERPENVKKWSVQFPKRPGFVYPNCLFVTEEEARLWVLSWRESWSEDNVGSVWTRDSQHDPWRPADEDGS